MIIGSYLENFASSTCPMLALPLHECQCSLFHISKTKWGTKPKLSRHRGQAEAKRPPQTWGQCQKCRKALTWQMYDAPKLWPWNFTGIFSPHT